MSLSPVFLGPIVLLFWIPPDPPAAPLASEPLAALAPLFLLALRDSGFPFLPIPIPILSSSEESLYSVLL